MAKKIRGKFCERTVNPRRAFARASFRWKRSGRAWVLIGCPRGKWKPRAERCTVGTRAHKLLAPAPAGACPTGRRVVK